MSEGEYETWSSAVEDLNREALEWSGGVQTCVVIGQSGDLTGFRDCIKDEFRGFEDSVYLARDTTDGLMEHTGKQCLSTLKSYRKVLVNFAATNGTVFTFAESLSFAQMGEASTLLPRASRRYARFARNTMQACEPR